MTESIEPDRYGKVEIDGEEATLRFQRWLKHPPETVWEFLTNASRLIDWYMTEAIIRGGEGGHVDFYSGPSRLHVTGVILTWDPPRLFEHEWKVEPRPEIPSGENAVIRWELSPEGNGTLLSLVHRNLNTQTAIGFAPGTHAFLDRLEAQIDGKPLPEWQERYQMVASRYPPSWVSRQEKH